MFNSEHLPTRTTRLSSSLSATILSTTTTTRDEHAMEDIALEEKLDELDPLRHLRNDDDIVPVQPKSVHNETLDLSFPPPPHGLPQAVAIRLAVDASPGCGGIAWPAGQVRRLCPPRSSAVFRHSTGPLGLHRAKRLPQGQIRPRARQRYGPRWPRRCCSRCKRRDYRPSVRYQIVCTPILCSNNMVFCSARYSTS